MTTTLDLLCCCGTSLHMTSDELVDVQTERATFDERHRRCLPDIPDEIAAKATHGDDQA